MERETQCSSAVESGLGPESSSVEIELFAFAALQQIIFNADSPILDRMVRDLGRTTQVS